MIDLFNIGDVVIYGAQGICKISCIETKQIGKDIMNYYVLKPIYNENNSVFVPVDNAVLTAKMKDVLNIEQAKELIKKAGSVEVLSCTGENQKREQYKDVLAVADREKLLSLIKTIYKERDARRDMGKKLNLFDEQALRKAELLICNELAYVFDVTPAEAQNMIVF